MEHRFRPVNRDQQFLLPPDVRDWLPAGHPALFLTELVAQLDLSAFVAANRSTRDRGRPAYHPAVMVGICLYASMGAVMSSRRIERLLATDVGFRVVACNERPDHGTICRFLVRHHDALKDLFAQVVGLAAEAGLVDPTMVALDGTKMAGDASLRNNRKLGDLRARYQDWSEEVAANDAADDEAEAENPPSGPVPDMADHDTMAAWIRRRLQERAGEPEDRHLNLTDPDSGILPRHGGGFMQGYNAQAAAVESGIVVAADVTASPVDSKMLEPMTQAIAQAIQAATGQPAGVIVADAGYSDTTTIERIEADDQLPDLLVATGRATPTAPPAPLPEPDLAAYAHALAAHHQAREQVRQQRTPVIARVVAGQLLLREAATQLGLSVPRVYELKRAWEHAGGPDGIPLPKSIGRPRPQPPRPPTPAARARHAMDTRLASPAGRSLYRQRQSTIEPVFGDIKTNRRITRFLRRGTDKIRTEWNWILTGHNLTILHHHTG
jgi:transposase